MLAKFSDWSKLGVMSLRFSPETRRPEQDRDDSAEVAFKQNVADLLSTLAKKVDADLHSGSSYLAIRATSKDQATGLSRGFTVLTDRTFGEHHGAAYHQTSEGYVRSYGMHTLNFLFVDELSPGNLNVKNLWWERQNGAQCTLTEEGLAGKSVMDVLNGHHGRPVHERLADAHGVRAEEFLLFEGIADAKMIDEVFDQVLAPESQPDTAQPFTFHKTDVIDF